MIGILVRPNGSGGTATSKVDSHIGLFREAIGRAMGIP